MTFDEQNFSRREVIAAVAATAALLPNVGFAATPARNPRFAALLAQFSQEMLQLTPEQATSLGVDKGRNAGLRAQLAGGSPADDARWAAQVASMRRRLAGIDRKRLSAAEQVQYDTVDYAAARGVEGAKFRYGGGAAAGVAGGSQPYVVTQQDGAVVTIPEFLNSQHPVNTAADADAYLARVSVFAKILDDESAALTRNAAIGVMPPDFIAATALGQLKEFRGQSAAGQPLVESLARRAKAAGLAGDWAARCTRLVAGEVYPALDRQIAAFAKSTAKAPHDAGVQRLPDGDAYYRWGLQLGTTTTLSPAEIHRTGLEQNRALKSRMDAVLKAQGMTKGTVGERVTALNRDPRFLYPDTDAGRAQLIAYIEGRIAAMRALMPRVSHMKLSADVQVKRVPVDIQDGASLGYMQPAALNGTRPAIYYVNLKSTSLWPKYQLATLSAHEAVPGHSWQFAYLAENSKDVPQIASQIFFNAFTEGWALYSEQLVDELGLYADDPFSQIGYLQALQFRACRLVADTGLHAMRWTRAQTVQFLATETGKGVDAMTSETDRYCVSPGQACGYKVGHNEIVRLRDAARASLGPKFDLAAFDDMVVRTGGVPLTVLATVVDGFVARGGTT